MNRVKSIIDSLVESQEDVIVKNLRELGFTVTRNDSTEDDRTYTVEKDGQVLLLDLTSDEDLHDSFRSIQAAFDMGMDLDDKGFPTMRTTSHSLAQRVASIGEGRLGLWDTIRRKKLNLAPTIDQQNQVKRADRTQRPLRDLHRPDSKGS